MCVLVAEAAAVEAAWPKQERLESKGWQYRHGKVRSCRHALAAVLAADVAAAEATAEAAADAAADVANNDVSK